MLRITLPSNNIEERKYLLDVIFNQFLKIPYKITLSKKIRDEYIIYLENNKSIIIKDYFFSLYPNNLEYLHIDSIPQNIDYFSHKLTEKEIPILFGKTKLEIKKESITSHIDIFATIFFMLTRWEEHVITSRDNHNRFRAIDSLAFKFDFLEKPIVNEYIEFLWNMLTQLGYDKSRYKHNFSMVLTHDVDETLAYPTNKKFLKKFIGDIVIRKKPLLAIKRAFEYINQKKDPYDTFDEIMDISDRYRLKSNFFFMSGGTSRYDNRYNIESLSTKKLIKKIKARGHYIGFHPSYNAYNDFKQFKFEKEALKSSSNLNIVSGREHYLRFELPTTWQIWEDNSMQWCSNMAFANHSGFRAGVCYSFTPFNILTRKQLKIKEKPITVMEVTLITESDSVESFEKKINYYLDIVKKYNGEFVFLWHNSNFKNYEDFSINKMKAYSAIYEKTIKKYIELCK